MSNIFSMMVTAILVLTIPKLVNTETYGYYQLYLFYINYVGLLQFGWCDGIYLRLGGKYYEDLDKQLYSTQFCLLGLIEVVIYAVIFLGSLALVKDVNKHFIIEAVCIAAVGMCLRWFITFILQPTARIKEYAIVIVSEKILLLILTMVLMLSGYRSYKFIVIADIFSKYISLGIGILYCKDIIFSKILSFQTAIQEIKENISSGIKLMLASINTTLITGVVRLGIECHWDISTFGKVSLTLSISNMVVTAINAVGVVIYPILRRTNKDKLTDIYKIMRIMLMGLVFGALVFYYPAQKILTLWLPQYTESLRYAAILLPICVYESKVSILINTYFNTLRLESLQMKCNLISLVFSIILTCMSIYVFDSVTATIFSILIVLMFRCVLCEIVLSTKLPIAVVKDIVIETFMTATFVICNWYFKISGMLIYMIGYVIYLAVKRRDIKEAVGFIKAMR